MAKALGGGVRRGDDRLAEAADVLTAGSPPRPSAAPDAAAAGLAVVDTIGDEGMLERCKKKEHRFHLGHRGAQAIPGISEVRGRGALLGVVLTADVAGSMGGAAAIFQLPHQARPPRGAAAPPRPLCSPTRRWTPLH